MVLVQYPAVTLRGLADVFPAMPHSDYQRFTLYFATIEEFAAKIPRGEGATEDERKVAEVLFARGPVRKMGEYKRLITGLGRTLPPHVDFFRVIDGDSSAVDAMEEWLTPDIQHQPLPPPRRAHKEGPRERRQLPPADEERHLPALGPALPPPVRRQRRGRVGRVPPEEVCRGGGALGNKVQGPQDGPQRAEPRGPPRHAPHGRLPLRGAPPRDPQRDPPPHLGSDESVTAKYAPIRTALEGQVSQRAFLPDKLKAEFDCLGAVSAPEFDCLGAGASGPSASR